MPQSIIKKIVVSQLFGKFDYQIPPDEGAIESPAILYGDNGVGKSTILALTFHILSSADDKGHRTAIQKIPFKELSVYLSSDCKISAKRIEERIDSDVIEYTISKDGKLIAEWIHSPSNSFQIYDSEYEDHLRQYIELSHEWSLDEITQFKKRSKKKGAVDDGVARGNAAFIRKLDSIAPKMFYLNADRKLESDQLVESHELPDVRRIFQSREAKSFTDVLRISRSISLTQALENAAKWVNRRAVSDANRGSENTHTAYETILDQISINYSDDSRQIDFETVDRLKIIINNIENDTKQFSKYELAAELRMENFRRSLNTSNSQSYAMAARLVEPYLRGLVTKLDAVRPLYQVIDSFVDTINNFFSGKSLHFNLSKGFYIIDSVGASLSPSQLSSGEQQLLLIFSNVLAAREHPSVFIIDEPEISLNIKWQRKIVGALLSIAEGSAIQFVFASHSLELIAQHSDSVVSIGRQ